MSLREKRATDRVSAENKKFFDDFKTIYTAVVQDGVDLKEDVIQVCLHDVNVSIYSPNIREVEAEYDKETGKYKYSIMS